LIGRLFNSEFSTFFYIPLSSLLRVLPTIFLSEN
jgi:hypothetical protein